jgi:F-type H+-transporting ATPase subunit c
MEKTMKKCISTLGLAASALVMSANSAFAQGSEVASSAGSMLPLAIGIVMAGAAFGGTSAQGKALSSALESIGRNPTAKGDIFVPMLLGLAFIESLVILGFVIAIQLVGKI